MVKESLLHEYPLINYDILTKSHTECCAHAKAEYKIQLHCDKRIMSQKQILCSAIQHKQFAQRETNIVYYTEKRREIHEEIQGVVRNFRGRKQKTNI